MKHALKFFFLFVFLANFLFADSQVFRYTYRLHKGWNLIGITLKPTEASKQQLLNHGLYGFEDNSDVKAFCRASDVTAGKAYWIYCETNGFLALTGTQTGTFDPDDSLDPPGFTPDEPFDPSEYYEVSVGTVSRQASSEEVTVTAPAKEGHTFK